MTILKIDIETFGAVVNERFGFLQCEFGLGFAGVHTVDGDPRDSYLTARYRDGQLRVDITWSPSVMSLEVLIRVDTDEVKRRERYIRLEPFIEFASKGELLPIIPQIHSGMSIENIERTMQRREQLLGAGIGNVIGDIAERLRTYLPIIRRCSPETIRRYQDWYESRGKATQQSIAATIAVTESVALDCELPASAPAVYREGVPRQEQRNRPQADGRGGPVNGE